MRDDSMGLAMTVRIEGAVGNPCELEFTDFARLGDQVADVSEFVPGRSGGAVRLRAALAVAGLDDEATHLTVEASDGSFSACVPLDAVLDAALLTYREGDAPLPDSKGGPVRMLIPGAASSDIAGVDACANVKYVGLLLATVGPGHDTRPATATSHEQLHQQPGHQHLDAPAADATVSNKLDPPGRIFWDGAAYTDLDQWQRIAAELRRNDPVHKVDGNAEFGDFWAVTRHRDVCEVEKQHDKFLNTSRSVLFPLAAYQSQEEQGLVIESLVHMDDPLHRAYRGLTNDWFKPGNLKKTVGTRVDQLAKRFVDRMLEYDGECDFARDIGLFYPLHVIMSLFGVPESDEPLMLSLTQQLFGNEDVEFASAERVEAIITAVLGFKEYFDKLTAARRAQPADDIATVIANALIDGKRMSDMEQLSYYMIIATAGHDTTSSSVTGGLGALLWNPDQLAALQADPSLMDNAVDEMIRWVTPVRHFMRHATEDYVLGGKKIAAGDRLLMSYLSANRDETVFEDPDRFDIRRHNADQHLAFGIGVHFCLGAHLARMEMRAFFNELLPRLEFIELAGDEKHTTASFVGGIKNLPIRYRLRAG